MKTAVDHICEMLLLDPEGWEFEDCDDEHWRMYIYRDTDVCVFFFRYFVDNTSPWRVREIDPGERRLGFFERWRLRRVLKQHFALLSGKLLVAAYEKKDEPVKEEPQTPIAQLVDLTKKMRGE